MMRLFIAAPIGAEVERELARIIPLLKQAGGSVKWVATSNIHLTLKFLGDTGKELIPKIKDIINMVASSHKAVPSTLNALGAFPNLNRPRVYWVNLTGGEAELGRVALKLDEAIHGLGFEKESRPFRPHLTLGRVKFPDNPAQLNEIIRTIRLNPTQLIFDRIILFKSTLAPGGSIYEIVHKAKLE